MGLIFLIGVNKFHLDVLDLDLTLQVSVFSIVVTVVVIIWKKLFYKKYF
jgi:membrane protein implicated in regulation of membrane protease activity